MSTDISIEPNAPYPTQPEVELEPDLSSRNFPRPQTEVKPDVSGAASFPVSGKGAGFEVGVGGASSSAGFAGHASSVLIKGGSLKKNGVPKKFRGPDQNPDSTLLRHVTHCSICNHPDREAIEQAILHWYSPTVIVHEFDLADRRIVYRHAHAFGLFHLRAEQSRHALGFLIEQAQSIVPTADAIIRAVRALSCIDDHGHWHEPRKEVVITHRYEDATSGPAGEKNLDGVEIGEPQPRRLVSARSSRQPNAKDAVQ